MRKRIPLHLAVSKAPTEQRIIFVRFLLSYHTYVDMSQLSPQERRRYGHLLHGPSLARSDSGFSSLPPSRQNSESSNSNNSVVSSISRRFFSGSRRGWRTFSCWVLAFGLSSGFGWHGVLLVSLLLSPIPLHFKFLEGCISLLALRWNNQSSIFSLSLVG